MPRRGWNLPRRGHIMKGCDMDNPTPGDGGWYLDEYDGDRFWSHVNFRGGRPYEGDPLATATGECWLWRGISQEAYATFRIFGSSQPSHRLAYRDFGKRLAEDDKMDHLCRVHSCVNPAHLEAVTHEVNMQRGKPGQKTHCPSGHAYDDENTKVVMRAGNRIRYCKICTAASRHRSYLRRKAA